MEDKGSIIARSQQDGQPRCPSLSSSSGAPVDNNESEESQPMLDYQDEDLMEVPGSTLSPRRENYCHGFFQQFLLFGCGVGCSLCCKFPNVFI